jgi:hypothetical protein
VGEFERVWEDLILPLSRLTRAVRKNRSFKERSQRLFDGPFTAGRSDGNTGRQERNRSMGAVRTANCPGKKLPTEKRRGWEARNIAETTVNKGCRERQGRRPAKVTHKFSGRG